MDDRTFDILIIAATGLLGVNGIAACYLGAFNSVATRLKKYAGLKVTIFRRRRLWVFKILINL